jgi:hypothetical protein
MQAIAVWVFFFSFLTGGVSRYYLIMQVYDGRIYLMVHGGSCPARSLLIFFDMANCLERVCDRLIV